MSDTTAATASLQTVFRFAHASLERNLAGISEAEALSRPERGGNSINWVVGHLLVYRDGIHGLLGLPPAWPASLGDPAPYRRNTDGELREPAPLAALQTAFDASQQALMSRLARLTAGRLAEPATDTMSVAEQLGFLGFHEGYHAGQVGLARRLLGKEGAI